LREEIRLYLEYLGAGMVAAIWAVPFVIAESFGWTHWALTAVPVVGAFVTSLFIWRPFGRRELTTMSPDARRGTVQVRDRW
jgi:membrane protein implicated in regulation of membrane protease activity